jgi:uncharacterized membrane protein/protein-disulfide isomerase
MTTTVRRILLALALVGLASSLASLYVHYQMLARPGYLSFCDVSATVSCSAVERSAYASVWGVPVALFGAGYYVVVALLLAASVQGPGGLPEHAAGYIFALSTMGLGASLFLAYVAFFIIKAVCVMCLVTYVAVIGLFLVSGARTSFPMTTLPRRLWQDARAVCASPAGLTVVIVFIIAASTALAFFPRRADPSAAAAVIQGGSSAQQTSPVSRKTEFLRFWESQQRVQVPVPADGAAVLIVKFSDYQCPACAQTHEDYKPILAKYAAQFPGVIRLVTKDYPLDRECNAGLPRDLHFASCEAAVAARLARTRGRGDAMEDWLYANHATLTPAAVRQAAMDIGRVLDFDAQYATTINQIESDIGLATILNIKVTPTFYINGVRLEGGLPVEYFEMALQYELKKAGKLTP